MTTGEWLDWWADNILPGTVKPSTERQYRQVVRTWLKPHLPPKVPLAKLKADHVVTMMRALAARGLSPTTQAMARTILRRSLKHAERFGRVTRNVVTLTDPPKRSGHKLDDSLSPEEAAKVIQAAKGDRLGALAIFVLFTGARQAEVLDLRWSDLDLDHINEKGVPAPFATIHGTKSRSSDREIPLPPLGGLRPARPPQAPDRRAHGGQELGRTRPRVHHRNRGDPDPRGQCAPLVAQAH